jgi:TatD DNase family protein
MLTDSHCHLGAGAFDDDREEVLVRAAAGGVRRAVVIASDADEAADIVAWAGAGGEDHHGVCLWSTAGVHPHYAERATPEALAAVEALNATGPSVAVGECGLDFHYDHAPRAVQVDAFRAQCEIADRTGRPLVVHSRSADPDTRDALASLPDGVRGVLHCFTAGEELMREALALGWHVSFSGIVTFARFDRSDIVRAVPDDRLLIETDSPYLAPVPHRGKRNEPAFVARTCAVVAEMRGVSVEQVAELTSRNATELFGISEPA